MAKKQKNEIVDNRNLLGAPCRMDCGALEIMNNRYKSKLILSIESKYRFSQQLLCL